MSDSEQGYLSASKRQSSDQLAPILAIIVIVIWATSLWYAFYRLQTGMVPNSIASICMILWVQFLYCGLFIITHDACHGSASPGNPRLNRWLGKTSALLYAAFDFDQLVSKHRNHHIHVATTLDPDFHDQSTNGEQFFSWGWRFFREYLSVRQLIIMMSIAQFFFHVLKIPERNVIQFWILPAILSGIQLFYFGTWLPHRAIPGKQFSDHHHARDSGFPWLLSLVSCWHFGYHLTHHLKPGAPWFQLPSNRRKS